MSLVYSDEAKKKSFLVAVRLLKPGRITGPPMLKPVRSTPKNGLALSFLMRR